MSIVRSMWTEEKKFLRQAHGRRPGNVYDKGPGLRTEDGYKDTKRETEGNSETSLQWRSPSGRHYIFSRSGGGVAESEGPGESRRDQ